MINKDVNVLDIFTPCQIKIALTNKLLKELLHFGRQDLQNEVIALGSGKKYDNVWSMDKFTPITNVVKDAKYEKLVNTLRLHPATDYFPNPPEFLNFLKTTSHYDGDESKPDFVVIFHTHPHGRAIPSGTDIAHANTEGSGYDAVYIIFSPRFNEISFNYHDNTFNGFKTAKSEIIL